MILGPNLRVFLEALVNRWRGEQTVLGRTVGDLDVLKNLGKGSGNLGSAVSRGASGVPESRYCPAPGVIAARSYRSPQRADGRHQSARPQC